MEWDLGIEWQLGQHWLEMGDRVSPVVVGVEFGMAVGPTMGVRSRRLVISSMGIWVGDEKLQWHTWASWPLNSDAYGLFVQQLYLASSNKASIIYYWPPVLLALCEENSPVTGSSPHKGPIIQSISMWWCHHDISRYFSRLWSSWIPWRRIVEAAPIPRLLRRLVRNNRWEKFLFVKLPPSL